MISKKQKAKEIAIRLKQKFPKASLRGLIGAMEAVLLNYNPIVAEKIERDFEQLLSKNARI